MSTTQTTLFRIPLARSLTAARYQQRLCTQAAAELDTAGWHVISYVFRFTAAQEEEHAAILTGLLGDMSYPPEADTPLPELDAPAAWLSAAIDHESACCGNLLPEAARAAMEAGQPRIAATLEQIAENDRRHTRRFLQYLHALEDGTLLRSDTPTSWFCLPCGCLHHGCEAPAACEACGANRGHFIRSSFHPFALA